MAAPPQLTLDTPLHGIVHALLPIRLVWFCTKDLAAQHSLPYSSPKTAYVLVPGFMIALVEERAEMQRSGDMVSLARSWTAQGFLVG